MFSEPPQKKTIYLIGDSLAIIFTFLVLACFFNHPFLYNPKFLFAVVFCGEFYAIWLDTYSSVFMGSYREEIKSAFIFSLVILVISVLVVYGTHLLGSDAIVPLDGHYMFSQLFLGTGLLFLGRLLVKLLSKVLFVETSNVILLTNFKSEEKLVRELYQNGYRVLAYFSQNAPSVPFLQVPILHDFEEVRRLLSQNEVSEVFVTSDAFSDFDRNRDHFNALGLSVNLAFDVSREENLSKLTFHRIGSISTLTSSLNHIHLGSLIFKRLCDIVFSIIGLFITGIVAIIIYPIVQKQSRGSLIFKQKRVGKNGKIFEIYKFRSMYLDAEKRKKELMKENELTSDLMFKMKDDPRIFPFGQKMRNWSIDELPQFINVLKGEMSLIGTRPPTVNEYSKYELHHFKRLAMKPGITGMWQVNGRSNITDFEEVVALDMYYIKNWSIWLDVKIFLKTIKVILVKEGSK
ncbi:sugar transferase [Streptococcus sciuri]|uniref:Sugar transferase n=1 Tax=Streptococcus sciuri TaxID=2973939 RepID=A0ABT2F7A0_9STRE|nr:sugar transferase [Streptococcus sciuri]MCS4487692.1 sugar transferase [Streptococcus sciuri]